MAKKELSPNTTLALVALVFLAAYFTPFDAPRVAAAVQEALLMLGDSYNFV